ncbi:unnamed protein product [Heterosigma akashiwo]
MERGYWLLLDNVNLCPASVLDRLNSVMEVGGELLLSEGGGGGGEGEGGGGPRRVRPHPGFRLLLAMDPRAGEVSRAMRNRKSDYLLCMYMTIPAVRQAQQGPERGPGARPRRRPPLQQRTSPACPGDEGGGLLSWLSNSSKPKPAATSSGGLSADSAALTCGPGPLAGGEGEEGGVGAAVLVPRLVAEPLCEDADLAGRACASSSRFWRAPGRRAVPLLLLPTPAARGGGITLPGRPGGEALAAAAAAGVAASRARCIAASAAGTLATWAGPRGARRPDGAAARRRASRARARPGHGPGHAGAGLEAAPAKEAGGAPAGVRGGSAAAGAGPGVQPRGAGAAGWDKFLVHVQGMRKALACILEHAAKHIPSAYKLQQLSSRLDEAIEDQVGSRPYKNVLWKRGGHPSLPNSKEGFVSKDILAKLAKETQLNGFQLPLSIEELKAVSLPSMIKSGGCVLYAKESLRREVFETSCLLDWATKSKRRDFKIENDLQVIPLELQKSLENQSKALIKMAEAHKTSDEVEDEESQAISVSHAAAVVAENSEESGTESFLVRWAMIQNSVLCEHWVITEGNQIVSRLVDVELKLALEKEVNESNKGVLGLDELVNAIAHFCSTLLSSTFISTELARPFRTVEWALSASLAREMGNSELLQVVQQNVPEMRFALSQRIWESPFNKLGIITESLETPRIRRCGCLRPRRGGWRWALGASSVSIRSAAARRAQYRALARAVLLPPPGGGAFSFLGGLRGEFALLVLAFRPHFEEGDFREAAALLTAPAAAADDGAQATGGGGGTAAAAANRLVVLLGRCRDARFLACQGLLRSAVEVFYGPGGGGGGGAAGARWAVCGPRGGAWWRWGWLGWRWWRRRSPWTPGGGRGRLAASRRAGGRRRWRWRAGALRSRRRWPGWSGGWRSCRGGWWSAGSRGRRSRTCTPSCAGSSAPWPAPTACSGWGPRGGAGRGPRAALEQALWAKTHTRRLICSEELLTRTSTLAGMLKSPTQLASSQISAACIIYIITESTGAAWEGGLFEHIILFHVHATSLAGSLASSSSLPSASSPGAPAGGGAGGGRCRGGGGGRGRGAAGGGGCLPAGGAGFGKEWLLEFDPTKSQELIITNSVADNKGRRAATALFRQLWAAWRRGREEADRKAAEDAQLVKYKDKVHEGEDAAAREEREYRELFPDFSGAYEAVLARHRADGLPPDSIEPAPQEDGLAGAGRGLGHLSPPQLEAVVALHTPPPGPHHPRCKTHAPRVGGEQRAHPGLRTSSPPRFRRVPKGWGGSPGGGALDALLRACAVAVLFFSM